MSSSAPARSRSLPKLTDVEWLQSLSATMRSPAGWQSALRQGDIPSVAKQLRERFAIFKKRDLLSTLRWSADPTIDAMTIEAIDELGHLSQRKGRQLTELFSGTIEAWLDRQPRSGIPSLLDQILAGVVLLERAARLSDGVLVRLWRFVEEHAGQVTSPAGTQHPAVRELLTTEMQLLRLVATSAMSIQKSDVQPVVTAVRQFLGMFSDDEGNPAAAIHASLGAALASLARLVEVFDRLDLTLVDKAHVQRLESLASRAVTLFPVDCSWIPSRTPHEALDWMWRVSRTFHLSEAESTQRLMKVWAKAGLDTLSVGHATPPKSKRGSRPSLKKKQLLSHQSDPSRYALLHGDGRESRDRCVVRYAESVPSLELSVRERSLLGGDWTASVTVGGKTWSEGEWSCCCWYSDAESDFCELKWEPARGVVVNRQLLWSRVHRFMVIADEVRAAGQADIVIESHLTLASGWKALADGRTREWQLHQSQSVVRLFPIFCAQEKVHHTDGVLRCDAHSIMTRNTVASTGVYSAFVIDWDTDRQNSPVQWGPLTIAEDGQRVPSHLACGARWRVADDLWMVFHQPEKGDSARSSLGLHTHHETVIARVDGGKYQSLVEVE